MPDRSTAPPTVRRATLDDVESVRAVGRDTWPATYGPLLGERYVADGLQRWWSVEAVSRGIADLTTYVAEDPGDVIGCAVVGELDGQPMLWKLYVLPRAQRTGAGKTLLDAVVAGLPGRARVLRLDHAADNAGAHAFYAGQGFIEVGVHGEGAERQVRMERPIER